MNEGNQRIVDLGFMISGLLLWLVLSNLSGFLWDWQQWPTYEGSLPVALYSLISLTISFATVLGLRFYPRYNSFFLEAMSELRKVTWPERKTTLYSTGVVIVAILFAGVVLYAFDVFWGWAISRLMAGGA